MKLKRPPSKRHSMWPNMRVQMECHFLSPRTSTPLPMSPCHLLPKNLLEEPCGKNTLLIWLDNLFSHINFARLLQQREKERERETGGMGERKREANEKCVINEQRLNASRIRVQLAVGQHHRQLLSCNTFSSAALKDIRISINIRYTYAYFIHISYTHMYIYF